MEVQGELTKRSDRVFVAIGGVLALLLALSFSISGICLLATWLFPGVSGGMLPQLRDNWILVFLQLNAGINGAQQATLHGARAIDISVLALFGILFFSQFPLVRRTSRIWWILTLTPLLGIVLLFLTGTGGRTGVPTSGLLMAILMLINRRYTKASAILGIVANGVILATIEGLSMFVFSPATAVIMAFGYALLIIWLASIGLASLLSPQGYGASRLSGIPPRARP
jgi:hypothetical protein